jgi:hypothetical protein
VSTARSRDLTALFDQTERVLRPLFGAMDWAETEITRAARRHRRAADRIRRSFILLRPTNGLETSQLAYRAHCRELLNRVAAGADTRPATAAECCKALSEISLRTPLNTAAAGLYARMWLQAGLPPTPLGDLAEHYEAIDAAAIDDYETLLRRQLHQNWRVTPDAA